MRRARGKVRRAREFFAHFEAEHRVPRQSNGPRLARLALIYRRIKAGDSDPALKWYRGLRQAILTPEEQPNRCRVTPENDKLRHLLYGGKPQI